MIHIVFFTHKVCRDLHSILQKNCVFCALFYRPYNPHSLQLLFLALYEKTNHDSNIPQNAMLRQVPGNLVQKPLYIDTFLHSNPCVPRYICFAPTLVISISPNPESSKTMLFRFRYLSRPSPCSRIAHFLKLLNRLHALFSFFGNLLACM